MNIITKTLAYILALYQFLRDLVSSAINTIYANRIVQGVSKLAGISAAFSMLGSIISFIYSIFMLVLGVTVMGGLAFAVYHYSKAGDLKKKGEQELKKRKSAATQDVELIQEQKTL